MEKLALLVASIIFLAVSCIHLLRLIFKAEVKVAGFILPFWVSTLGFSLTLLLSMWMLTIIRG